MLSRYAGSLLTLAGYPRAGTSGGDDRARDRAAQMIYHRNCECRVYLSAAPSPLVNSIFATAAQFFIDPRFHEAESTVLFVFIFYEHVCTDHSTLFNVPTAMEIRGIVGAATTIVDGCLRISADRPCAARRRSR
jgi:hypothetical protein